MQRVGIASDHGGFELKERVKGILSHMDAEVVDYGCHGLESVDYPDFGKEVAKNVAQGNLNKGVVVCTTGTGMSIVANKVNGVRAALCHVTDSVIMARKHNDANVLALGSRYVDEKQLEEMLSLFLHTDFEGGRHSRRVEKLEEK